jgi:type VI secretion system secreted protein Hcp
MAFDAFLKLDGIDGDSLVRGYEKWIEVMSFSWGVSQGASHASGGGGGAGKAVFQDLSFVVNFSKASPELFKRCATGEHIKSGVLSVRKAGEKPLEFYKVRLTDVLVSSFQDSNSSGADQALNSVSLNFTDLALDFTPQSDKG